MADKTTLSTYEAQVKPYMGLIKPVHPEELKRIGTAPDHNVYVFIGEDSSAYLSTLPIVMGISPSGEVLLSVMGSALNTATRSYGTKGDLIETLKNYADYLKKNGIASRYIDNAGMDLPYELFPKGTAFIFQAYWNRKISIPSGVEGYGFIGLSGATTLYLRPTDNKVVKDCVFSGFGDADFYVDGNIAPRSENPTIIDNCVISGFRFVSMNASYVNCVFTGGCRIGLGGNDKANKVIEQVTKNRRIYYGCTFDRVKPFDYTLTSSSEKITEPENPFMVYTIDRYLNINSRRGGVGGLLKDLVDSGKADPVTDLVISISPSSSVLDIKNITKGKFEVDYKYNKLRFKGTPRGKFTENALTAMPLKDLRFIDNFSDRATKSILRYLLPNLTEGVCEDVEFPSFVDSCLPIKASSDDRAVANKEKKFRLAYIVCEGSYGEEEPNLFTDGSVWKADPTKAQSLSRHIFEVKGKPLITNELFLETMNPSRREVFDKLLNTKGKVKIEDAETLRRYQMFNKIFGATKK